jgi:UDP-glucuronate decarboxylase
MASKEGVIGPLNLGNEEEFTVFQLAREVIKQTGSSSRIMHLPLPSDDPKVRKPDLTNTKAALGWQAKINLATGVAKTIPYFQKILSRTFG